MTDADQSDHIFSIQKENPDGIETWESIKKVLNCEEHYPYLHALFEQIISDLERYSNLRGADSRSFENISALKDLRGIDAPAPSSLVTGEHSKFRDAEALLYTVEGPLEDCIAVLRIELLESLLTKKRKKQKHIRLARQIRLINSSSEVKRNLMKSISQPLSNGTISITAFLALFIETSRELLDGTTFIDKTYRSLMNAIIRFFKDQQDDANKELPLIDKAIQKKFKKKFLKQIKKGNPNTTPKWESNALSAVPYSMHRLNKIERVEFLNNLEELSDEASTESLVAALQLSLMYSLGMKLEQVLMLTIGENSNISLDGHYSRRMTLPRDAGPLASDELCMPESYDIALPLPDIVVKIISKLDLSKTSSVDYFNSGYKNQSMVIQSLLKQWRYYGRYRIKVTSLVSALSTEISIRTQDSTLIYLLSSRPNHAPPTSAYYTAVSHKKLLEVWLTCQEALFCHD